MAQYHALISGLPKISLEGGKAPYTLDEFYTELSEVLSKNDLKLLDWLRLEEVNREFIALYRTGLFAEPLSEDSEDDELEHTSLPIREIKAIVAQAQQGTPTKRSEVVPSYMITFLNEAYKAEDENVDPEELTSPSPLSDEDRLAQLYYASSSNSKNAFLASWFEFNKNLRNILAVYICRQLGWDAHKFVVGKGEVEEKLLNSRAKDFELSEELPYIQQVVAIAEEQDISRRERLIDSLRWQWLEEETEWTVFDIENVLAYYLRLSILERWGKLDEEKGQAVFREIVLGLKKESNKSLQDFRERTKKN